MKDISTAIDKKEYAVGIFIDLKKAFDTTDHNILFHKLERYDFGGIAQNWLKDLLENRYQYTQTNDMRSNMLNHNLQGATGLYFCTQIVHVIYQWHL